MTELTKRQRVLRAARFEETDRVPLYDILENDAIIEHYGGERLTPENGRRVKGRAIGRTLDMTRMPYGPYHPGIRQEKNGLVIRQERWTSWIVQRPFRDVPSFCEWVKGEIRRTQALQYDAAYAEHFRQEVGELGAIFAQMDPTGRGDPTVLVQESGVGLTEMYWMAGLELFVFTCADQPGLMEEWLEARHQAELRRVAAIADSQNIPIALTYDDIAYKNGLLFSPKWLRKLWVPRLKALVEAWQARDVLCLFHSDGSLWSILDDLVEAGIDGLNPLEVMAGMSVGEVRQRYPGLFLTGGIDVSQLLPYATPGQVREACRQAIQEADGRGYFLGSTTELHWEVRLENARAMFETAWKG